MTNLGLGVMLRMLSGDDSKSAKAVSGAIGKTIGAVKIDSKISEDGGLVFAFTDGCNLVLRDGGRSCCEHRYMTTDDDLTYFAVKKGEKAHAWTCSVCGDALSDKDASLEIVGDGPVRAYCGSAACTRDDVRLTLRTPKVRV